MNPSTDIEMKSEETKEDLASTLVDVSADQPVKPEDISDQPVKLDNSADQPVKPEDISDQEVKPDDTSDQQVVSAGRNSITYEHFKIEINGFPKFFNSSQAKKLMSGLNLKPHKVKQCGQGARYMFVNFPNEEEREKAINAINGFLFKGNKLRAFKADAKKDPLIKIRSNKGGASQEAEIDPNLTPEEVLQRNVCKYADKTYEEQLTEKMVEVEKLMVQLRKAVFHQNAFLAKYGVTNDEIAKVEPFVRSPLIDGYRNKCEFSFGNHPKTGEITVGFRLARYKEGSVSVVGVDKLPIVSDKMKKIAKKFESFVKECGYKPFDFITHEGYWKQLTVRTSRTGEVLVWAILHPQDMSQEKRNELKKQMAERFVEQETDPEIKVTSLHIQFQGQRMKNEPEPEIECISGTSTIMETLTENKLKFTISPPAFFQINADGAEKVFDLVGEIADLDKNTTLFDVCCGTGTIGLCLASKCKKVYGIDIVPQSINDAKVNAERNNIQNAEFSTGRAEHVLFHLLKNLENDDGKHVAIVDPPRAGLHNKAIFALRSSSIQRLVYISCDAKAALQNFINLGQLPSNLYQGDPFIPKRVIPVDLFPHTPYFELIIYFERFPLMKLVNESTEKSKNENSEKLENKNAEKLENETKEISTDVKIEKFPDDSTEMSTNENIEK